MSAPLSILDRILIAIGELQSECRSIRDENRKLRLAIERLDDHIEVGHDQ